MKKASLLGLSLLLLIIFPLLPLDAQEADTDGDGLTDTAEDTNGNGKFDPGETDLFNADTDRGGESDGSEINAGRNPSEQTDDFTFDADGDGWINGVENSRGTDPKKKDTDGDGIGDASDPFPLSAQFKEDLDKNGLPDEWEKLTNIKSHSGQTLNSDPDQDGLTNEMEMAKGTDPLDKDTDGDGMTDKEEIDIGTNPRENACLSLGEPLELFPDVVTHWSKEFVSKMRRANIGTGTTIIQGYNTASGSVYLPDRAVTRFEFLKMALLSTCTKLTDNTIDVSIRFSDVKSIPDFEEDADQSLRRKIIYTAVQKGIVSGYEDNTFKPESPVSRAEAVKMLIKASKLSAPEDATNLTRIFPDVADSEWYKPYLSTALWYELVSGYEDGTFGGTRSITRAEATKILYKTMLINPLINGYILVSVE